MSEISPALELELEPIDPSLLRSTEATGVWETVRGKRNRITLGQPRWLDAAEAIEAKTMAQLSAAYTPRDFTLQVLQLSLTLLPDRDCRFRSADLVLTLGDVEGGESCFADLEPREETTTLIVTRERPGGHATLSVLSAVEVGVDTGARRTESTRSEATLEAFGTGSTEAGWRLSLRRGRDIPLDTPELRAVIARAAGHEGDLSITAVAEIDVLTPGDRWLTWAFKRRQPSVGLFRPLHPSRASE
jgi:hypothetical protein